MTTGEDINAFIHEPQAVLIAYFDWSKQGQRSLRVFKEWELEWRARHPSAPVGFYCVDHARYSGIATMYFSDIRDEKGMKGGYGAVGWFLGYRGPFTHRRLGVIRNAGRSGKATLSRLIDKSFGTVISTSHAVPS